MSNGKDWSDGKSPVQVWFTNEEHAMIKRAAESDHRSISSFVRAQVIPAAERIKDEVESEQRAEAA